MTEKFDRSAITAWADIHWCIPCEDGLVWTNHGPLIIEEARQKHHCQAADWYPVFLEPIGNYLIDWLFFIKRTWTRDKLLRVQFQQAALKPDVDYKVICTWYNAGPSYPGASWGLNDSPTSSLSVLRRGQFA